MTASNPDLGAFLFLEEVCCGMSEVGGGA